MKKTAPALSKGFIKPEVYEVLIALFMLIGILVAVWMWISLLQ